MPVVQPKLKVRNDDLSARGIIHTHLPHTLGSPVNLILDIAPDEEVKGRPLVISMVLQPKVQCNVQEVHCRQAVKGTLSGSMAIDYTISMERRSIGKNSLGLGVAIPDASEEYSAQNKLEYPCSY